MSNENQSMYEYIGKEKLEELVDTFYSYVSKHERLSPIFPGDWEETARKQKLFLTQFLGGPQYYSMERGHPRMRARHLPFPITIELAHDWLDCMAKAMDDVDLDEEIKEPLLQHLRNVAYHMVNQE
ncbi:globin domain-containing protein [Gottfriedia luciferensis]|uniref:globin domain-containing protein n=1 Tax=Gottfriedia luciferensis TaxID=178774 RepID=UPI0038B38FFB